MSDMGAGNSKSTTNLVEKANNGNSEVAQQAPPIAPAATEAPATQSTDVAATEVPQQKYKGQFICNYLLNEYDAY